MLFFGHVGVGELLTRPFSKGLPVKAVLLGTILPDLIDKSLYYIPSLLTGRHGAELGIISGTRSVGHCFLFLFIYAVFAFYSRRPFLVGLALGMFTHIPLDVVADYFRDRDINTFPEADPIYAYFFPFLGFHFPVIPYESMGQHAAKLFDKTIVGAEVFGLGILTWKFRKKLFGLFSCVIFLGLVGCGPGLDTPSASSCGGGEYVLTSRSTTMSTGVFSINSQAQSFSIQSSSSLRQIQFLGNTAAGNGSFSQSVSIVGDNGGIPGSAIIVENRVWPLGMNSQIITLDLNSPVRLGGGVYWVKVSDAGNFLWASHNLSPALGPALEFSGSWTSRFGITEYGTQLTFDSCDANKGF